MEHIDKEGNVTPTGPVGPAKLRWTYLRPYGAGDRYQADMHPQNGSDNVDFLRVGSPAPYEAEEGTLSLDVGTKEDVKNLIEELTWLLNHWGGIGRDT